MVEVLTVRELFPVAIAPIAVVVDSKLLILANGIGKATLVVPLRCADDGEVQRVGVVKLLGGGGKIRPGLKLGTIYVAIASGMRTLQTKRPSFIA